jgi:predicted HTH domain antitoxin
VFISNMTVTVPDSLADLLSSDHVAGERAVLLHLATALYPQGKLSAGAAAEVAGMTRRDFEQWLRDEGISMPWTVEDLEAEAAWVTR